MVDLILKILGGGVSLVGAALPVYFGWRAWKNAQRKKVSIAADDDRRHGWRERMRNRIAGGKDGGKKSGDV